MSTPRTPFEAFAAALRRHPLLRDVRTWRLRDGSTQDDDAPSATQAPWVRLTPTPRPSEPHTRLADAQPVAVAIETAVAGRDFGASAALWRRLHWAVFARDDRDSRRLREAVRAAGGVLIALEQAALPASPDDYGAALTMGRGSILIHIFVRTR